MDISMIVYLIALFIMLTAAITTEIIRSKRYKSIVNYAIFLNALVFLGALALFIRDHNPLYMVVGMFFSVGLLALTFFKHTDF